MRLPSFPPDHYADACTECGQSVAPIELDPDEAGWFAVYDHCGWTWTKGFADA